MHHAWRNSFLTIDKMMSSWDSMSVGLLWPFEMNRRIDEWALRMEIGKGFRRTSILCR